MTFWRPGRGLARAIYQITGVRPRNLELYRLALQHSSYRRGSSNSNERLEFLGDAVLSMILAEYLFKKYPNEREGFLTKIRSRVENRASLGHIAQQVGLGALLSYDKRSMAGSRQKYIHGNALEALIGAVYLDHGYGTCRWFVIRRLVDLHVDLHELIHCDTDYKSQLITWGNQRAQKVIFKVVRETGSSHAKVFTVQAVLGDQVLGEGAGNSKKQAEQYAAQAALQRLPQAPLEETA